jgi:proteasome lid subunit RPN8/RPN11
MELAISDRHTSIIAEHCQQAYPKEGCGILLGLVEHGTRWVVDVLPTGNAREEGDQHNRYLIPPESLLEGELQAEDRELEVIGYFHSHPDHPARPSNFDREHAWPWYSYLIVSVRNGNAVAQRSWQLREDQSGFCEETIVQPASDLKP